FVEAKRITRRVAVVRRLWWPHLKTRGFFRDVDTVGRRGLGSARSRRRALGRRRRRHREKPGGEDAGPRNDCGRFPVHARKNHGYFNISVERPSNSSVL